MAKKKKRRRKSTVGDAEEKASCDLEKEKQLVLENDDAKKDEAKKIEDLPPSIFLSKPSLSSDSSALLSAAASDHSTIFNGTIYHPVLEDQWPVEEKNLKTRDMRSSLKSLGIAYGEKTYPDRYTYRNMTGENFHQKGGTCYLAAACNFCKFVVWMYTGKRLSITAEEVYDLADEKSGDPDGGQFKDSKWVLQYTGSNECLNTFKSISDSIGVADTTLTAGSVTCTKENAIRSLNEYGPFWWGHGCNFYYSEALPGADGHAILGIGYNDSSIFFKNTWTDDDEDDSYTGYFSCSWRDFEENGWEIGIYNPKYMNSI